MAKSFSPVLIDCNGLKYIYSDLWFGTEEEALAFGQYNVAHPPQDKESEEPLVDVILAKLRESDEEPNARWQNGQASRVRGDKRVGVRPVVQELVAA